MRAFSNHSLDKLEKELSKCVLLCANCHREIHYSDLEMDLIPDKIKEMIENNQDKKSFSNNKPKEESICPTCGKSFPKVKGKIYCSKECRENDKHYPSIEEVNEQYELLGNWEKVAQHFGLTRKIIQGIRKRNS